jgi:hypothetical protein
MEVMAGNMRIRRKIMMRTIMMKMTVLLPTSTKRRMRSEAITTKMKTTMKMRKNMISLIPAMRRKMRIPIMGGAVSGIPGESIRDPARAVHDPEETPPAERNIRVEAGIVPVVAGLPRWIGIR